jgi:acetyltransferase-like isoleucine patch superfamily enzyme
MKRIINKIRSVFLCIDLIKFVHYNFFSRCIIRKKGCYLKPYKHSIINLDKSARIHINHGSIQIGVARLRGSNAETYLQMGENARWVSNGDAVLFYHTLIDIQKNAEFESGSFSANCGTVIVCAKKITLGDNIMMGRNIMIYDSDHHQMIDRNGFMINYDEEVTIRDNVWLTSNVIVLRGSEIGQGSIITAQTVIKGDVPPGSLAGGSTVKIVSINKIMSWKRESTHPS